MFPSFSQFLAIQTSMILVKKIQWISNFFLYLEHHGDITLWMCQYVSIKHGCKIPNGSFNTPVISARNILFPQPTWTLSCIGSWNGVYVNFGDGKHMWFLQDNWRHIDLSGKKKNKTLKQKNVWPTKTGEPANYDCWSHILKEANAKPNIFPKYVSRVKHAKFGMGQSWVLHKLDPSCAYTEIHVYTLW